LPRPDDVDSVPAWLELEHPYPTAESVWPVVAKAVGMRSTEDAVTRAVLLGLPVAGVGESITRAPVVPCRLGAAPPRALAQTTLVVDLSVMWAGPLCGDLLARAGATVLKVESTSRPDGARNGPAGFFDLLNGAKRSVAFDFTDRGDLGRLRELLRRADVVIESSRPRGLAQLGIDAAELVGSDGPQVWISITGYGRDGAAANRVAFGDDAAAAGGLVCMADSMPVFCADAIADPLTGLAAADACLHALETGGRWLLDVSMSAVSSVMAGPKLAVPPGVEVASPRARPIVAPAPALGAGTADVLRELGVS
jgi:crotonobetainyl-CoA:carnitine CoA-transferase CaiB-like acyl-CoA transferase